MIVSVHITIGPIAIHEQETRHTKIKSNTQVPTLRSSGMPVSRAFPCCAIHFGLSFIVITVTYIKKVMSSHRHNCWSCKHCGICSGTVLTFNNAPRTTVISHELPLLSYCVMSEDVATTTNPYSDTEFCHRQKSCQYLLEHSLR